MSDINEDTSIPPPGFTPPPRAPRGGSRRPRFIKAALWLVGIALAAAAVGVLAVPALASATQGAAAKPKKREPRMPVSYAKHESWDLAQDWKATREGEETIRSTVTLRCHRVRRSVVDCHTQVTFTESSETGSVDHHASWELRFRAGQAMGSPCTPTTSSVEGAMTPATTGTTRPTEQLRAVCAAKA